MKYRGSYLSAAEKLKYHIGVIQEYINSRLTKRQKTTPPLKPRQTYARTTQYRRPRTTPRPKKPSHSLKPSTSNITMYNRKDMWLLLQHQERELLGAWLRTIHEEYVIGKNALWPCY